MKLSRREFMELLGCTTAGVMISTLPGCQSSESKDNAKTEPAPKPALPSPIKDAIKGKADNLPVIWIQGQSCSGCSVSILNAESPDIVEVLTEVISLEFHQTVMGGTGDVSLEPLAWALAPEKKGKFILIVEGSVPAGEKAGYCTIGEKDHEPVTTEEWVKKLGANAKAVVAVGSCATFGGIPAARGNESNARTVSEVLPDATVINIPGCPSHPDWMVGTLAHVILFGVPELDDDKRPKMFFGRLIHETCERRAAFDNGDYAKDFGDPGCLYELGCKGPIAYCDASIRSWNSRVSWCVQAGGPCVGCTEPSFPDHDGDGLYGQVSYEKAKEVPWSGPHAPRRDGRPA